MEADISTCKVCQKVKVRISSGSFNAKSKRFVDENDKLWNGRTCPSCNHVRVQNKMKDLRAKRKHTSV